MGAKPATETLQGCIVRLHGKAAVARLEDGREVECVVRGRLKQGRREQRSPVAVGDRVTLAIEEDGSFQIHAIAERRGVLSRPSAHNARIEQVVAANVDQVMVTVAADTVDTYLTLVDRLLVAAGCSGLAPVVVVNKVDVVAAEALAGFVGLYRSLGFEVMLVSAKSGEGIPKMREKLRGRTTLFAGPSGAGKSSCLNAVHTGLSLRTGEVKESGGGRHTTTHVSLLALPGGGFVVDTPGVREFGLWSVLKAELGLWYPEFTAKLGQCKFPGCSHVHEPHCAIRAAVERGDIDMGRYQRYLRILELWDEPQSW